MVEWAKWRLGIDLGTDSLGWCALALNGEGHPCRILAGGSRIFGNGRNPKGASLAVDRRTARAMRRRRDRLKQRQRALIEHLTRDGLLPSDPDHRKSLEALDPYELRARALDEALAAFDLGRVFFQINQRRGFQSNRKTDRGTKNKDSKTIATGVDRLKKAIEDSKARTFGEFLHERRKTAINEDQIPSIRTRLRAETGEDAKGNGYDFYPSRDLIKAEFEAIWEAQQPHHPVLLTPERHNRLYEIIFHQRPLKAPQIGFCTLIPEETRLAKAHPLFQKRRLLEEVNALEILRPGLPKQKLTKDQRDRLMLALQHKKKISFRSLRVKILKLDPNTRFNKESDNREELAGDEIHAQFSGKTHFGNRWGAFSAAEQWVILQRLREEEDGATLQAWLMEGYALTHEQAKTVASTDLPAGYGRFGQTATQKLIEALEQAVIVYSEAVQRAGLGHHSDFRTGEYFTDAKSHPTLPYYGTVLERHIMPGTGERSDPEEIRVGRISNPTVHIGLNQLRRTLNTLIRAHGPPAEIALELARELKLSQTQKDAENENNKKNRLAAEQRSQKLREIGQKDTGANRARLKLWEELNPEDCLDRRCVYTGQQISIGMLFSNETEIDHILPLAETLDDSNANKILCRREANRQKRKQSPYDAFGASPDWQAIAMRAERLPEAKRWRFEPDAMQRFDDTGGFLARQLNDTRHLSKLARAYVATLYPGRGEDSCPVWVSPGRLTEMVRRKLGLNDLLPDHNISGGADQPKNRLDHRHHAIDAAVIAIVDRSLLQAAADASGQDGAEGRERIHIPPPWEGFRDALRQTVSRIIVSHRADHGTVSKGGLKKGRDQTAGQLHNDTAYGLTGKKDAKGNDLVVHRIPLTSITPEDLGADAAKGVRDPDLRAALREFTHGTEVKDKSFEAALRRFPKSGPSRFRGIRRLRVIEPLAVIPIKDRQGRAYKGYKGDSNYRYDVWEMPDGKWQSEIVSMFAAHQPGWHSAIRADCPTARKVLSLHQNDLIAIEQDGARRLMRIVKFAQSGSITFVEPHESGDLKRRDALPNDPFKYMARTASGLKKLQARQIRIDEIGRVQDPGFPARKRRRITRAKSG